MLTQINQVTLFGFIAVRQLHFLVLVLVMVVLIENMFGLKMGGRAFDANSRAGSDGHHLRPTEAQLNSTRGSLSFGIVPQTTANIVKQNGSTNYENLCYKS